MQKKVYPFSQILLIFDNFDILLACTFAPRSVRYGS